MAGEKELMEEIVQNQKLKQKIPTHPNSFSRWSIIIASLVFSFSAYMMLQLYGIVHWKIMLNNGIPRDDTILEHVYPLLNVLARLRFMFVVLAVVYSGLSYVHGPKWAAVLTSIFAGLAIMTIFIIM